ncbi:uncharacterized protein LOC122651063 [Telopea speciosissima]|uniref:uncharacterized protein LOC122651063 n=1 Tax=Telopea speciosissima TaxID=54955 RepID=UPI001CC53D76|nr:uncharacterized protein LOC122651063 [Telopea speciosissima]
MEVISRAQAATCEFLNAQKPQKNLVQCKNLQNHQLQQHWIPPEEGWVKVNSDASQGATMEKGGLGLIIRDHLGRPLRAVSEPCSFQSIRLGEALALRAGMIQALNDGWTKVRFESDNLEMISYLTRQQCNIPLEVPPVINDVFHLSPSFTLVSFSHIS